MYRGSEVFELNSRLVAIEKVKSAKILTKFALDSNLQKITLKQNAIVLTDESKQGISQNTIVLTVVSKQGISQNSIVPTDVSKQGISQNSIVLTVISK